MKDIKFLPAFLEYEIPCSEKIEMEVLGVAILYDKHQDRFFEIVNSEDFFTTKESQTIFLCLKKLRELSIPINTNSVYTNLVQNQSFPIAELLRYYEDTFMDHQFNYHLDLLQDLYLKRSVQKASVENIKASSSDVSPSEIIRKFSEKVTPIENAGLIKNKSKDEVFDDLTNRLQDMIDNKTVTVNTGISTGLKSLDDFILGYQPGKFYIIAGRPAMGKTSFVMESIFSATEKGKVFLVISLEMKKEELIYRITCSRIGLSTYHIKTGFIPHDKKISKLELLAKLEKIRSTPLEIDDSADCVFLSGMKRAIQATLKKHKRIDGLAIDYLQLMEPDSNSKDNRNQDMTKITKACKRIANDFNIPVIGLSQLSRAVELRQNKRPQLSDLRESGSIEQDADVIIFIYRDEYYNQDTDKRGEAELIIAKQREGETGTAFVLFDASSTKFKDKTV